MKRWLTAFAAWAALTIPCGAQDPDDVRTLLNRVNLEPEIERADPWDAVDNLGIASQLGQIFLPALPHGTSGYEILAAGILERLANDRYEKALLEYVNQLQEDEVRLALRPPAELRGSVTLTSEDAHALVHERLARLPASMLKRYRQRIDADAARLLAEGTSNRDPAPLRRLVREYRASEQADRALALLGDLAFERGDFELALDWWRRITPLPSHHAVNRQGLPAKEGRPGIDLPRIHAKETLALIFAARPEAARELDAFRMLYPAERGTLAGRTDAYHAILAHWLKEWRALPTIDDDAWPTFGGAASRNRILHKALDSRLWLDGAAWRTPLPQLDFDERAPIWLSSIKSLTLPPTPFHPVIAEGQVLFSDGQAVRSFDLLTGRARFRVVTNAPFVRPADFKPGSDLAYGLSIAPGRAFARLGIRPGDPEPRRLVAINIAPREPRLDRIVWTADANGEAPGAFFETDPLVVGDRIYIGVLQKGEKRTPRELLCFNLAGTLLWQVKLAEFAELQGRRPHRQALLVSTGSTIVYATHAGAVVAIDAFTGRRLWGFRYPSIEAGPSPRGPSTCLAADGRIYLAPVDAIDLYCIDADNGRVLWERPWLKAPSDIVAGPPSVSEVVDLLGVVEDRLIFTDRFRIQALDARTGGTLHWQQPPTGRLPGLGRGLLAGPWVYWPTADPAASWRTITSAAGLLRDADAVPEYYEQTLLRSLPAGNIVFGQGCLAVAGSTELVVYVPPARQLPQLERDPQVQHHPAKLFRLAMAQLDAGQNAKSQQTLATLEATVRQQSGCCGAAGLLEPAERSAWPAWQQLIHQRTTPKTPAAKRVPPPSTKTAKPSTTPPLSAPPPPTFAKLVPAWGPIAGCAPPIECADGTRGDDITVLLDGPEIAFLNARTGEELFRRTRRIAAVDWLGREGPNLLVAGRDGIEAFDVESRRPKWHLPAPALTDATFQLVGDQPQKTISPRRLSAFQIVHGKIIAFEDRDRRLEIDPATGAIEVDDDINPIRALVGSSRFEPAVIYAMRAPVPDVEGTLRFPMTWRQTINDPREPFDLKDSRRRQTPMIASALETHGEVRQLIGVRELRHLPPWPTSLTGAPANVIETKIAIIALVPRNQGFDLVRYDLHNREPRWTVPAIELRDGFDVLAAAWDDNHLYFISAGELQARLLDSGKLLWKKKLPPASGPWIVERAGGHLLVWAQSTAGLPAFAGPVDPISQSLILAAGRRHIGSVPILLVDPKDGAVKQRIDAPHDGGPAFVHRQGNIVIVTSGGQTQAWVGVP